MYVVLADENTFKNGNLETINQCLSDSNCSVHILFPQYLPLIANDSAMSIAKFQFYEAKKHLAIEKWKGDAEQTDDLLVIGIRI
jgi:hypothetical protein